jgi:hypothetical protein
VRHAAGHEHSAIAQVPESAYDRPTDVLPVGRRVMTSRTVSKRVERALRLFRIDDLA